MALVIAVVASCFVCSAVCGGVFGSLFGIMFGAAVGVACAIATSILIVLLVATDADVSTKVAFGAASGGVFGMAMRNRNATHSGIRNVGLLEIGFVVFIGLACIAVWAFESFGLKGDGLLVLTPGITFIMTFLSFPVTTLAICASAAEQAYSGLTGHRSLLCIAQVRAECENVC